MASRKRNPSKTDDNGRDESGRFVKGSKGGPGRPKGRDFRHVIEEAVGSRVDADIVSVYYAMLAAAKEGDVSAARLVIERLCGPVTQKHDHGDAIIRLITGVREDVEDQADSGDDA